MSVVNGKSFGPTASKMINAVKPAGRANRFFTFYFLVITFSLALTFPITAQEEVSYDDRPDDLVPPPLNIISKDESKQLEAEGKMKNRTKLALELMEARLLKSEELLAQNDYGESLNQIGIFQGLLIDTMKFLKRNQNNKGVENNYKRLELQLRDFMPRLELIRREMPYKYGYHIKHMLFFVRDARTRALNPLFDDTVLPEGSN
jgi:hypothetical protein